MKSLTTILLISILSFSSLLADRQQANVNGNNNLVTQIVNKGLSRKIVDKFIQPYKDRINSLERKLNRTVSMEEKYRLSEQLKELREELNKKNQQIQDLSKLIKNSSGKGVRIATEIYEKKGLRAVLEYFKSRKFKENVENTDTDMKNRADEYRVYAKFLLLDNKYDEAIEVYKRVLKYDRTAKTLFDYALLLQERDYDDKAILIYEQLLLEQKNLINIDKSIVIVGTVFNNLGLLYVHKGKMKKAEEYYLKSLKLRKKFVKTYLIAYKDLVEVLHNLAQLYMIKKENKKAEKVYQKILPLHKVLVRNNPPIYDFRMRSSLTSLVFFYESKKDIEEMEKIYEEVLIIYKTLANTDLLNYNFMVASTLTSLAYIYISKKKIKKAEKFLEEALVIRRYYVNRKLFSENNKSSLSRVLHTLAIVYKKNNKMKKATEVFSESLILYRALAKNNFKEYGVLLANSLVSLYLLRKNIESLTEAEEILKKFKGASMAEKLLKKIERLRKAKEFSHLSFNSINN